MEINFKEEIIKALNDKENKNHQDIIEIIFNFIPKNKVNDCFVFICKGAAKTEISPTIAKFVLDQLLRENDIESVNDAGDIENLKTAGDIITSVNVPYVMKKYPSIISDTATQLFDEFTKRYSGSPQFCGLIATMLDEFDNNTIQKIYDECVKNNYIEGAEDTEETSNETSQEDNSDNSVQTDTEDTIDINSAEIAEQ